MSGDRTECAMDDILYSTYVDHELRTLSNYNVTYGTNYCSHTPVSSHCALLLWIEGFSEVWDCLMIHRKFDRIEWSPCSGGCKV